MTDYIAIPCVHLPLDFAAAVAATTPDPESLAIRAQRRAQFLDVLSSLVSARDAAIVRALYFEDTTAKEAAQRFDTSTKNVERIRTAALKKLRSMPDLAALLRTTATR